MNQNVIIGILVVIILAAGGYYFFNANPALMGGPAPSPTSTTMPDASSGTTQGAGTSGSTPSAVTDTLVAPTNSTAVVSGKVTPNGAQTTYWYEYGTTMNFGSKTASQTIGSGFAPIPSPGYITSLDKNTLYYFRLDAENSFGSVTGLTYSFTTNNNPPGQGTAPGVNTNGATGVGRTSATLRASVNAHSSQTSYWFEYGTTPNFGQVTAFQSGGNGNNSNAVSASLSGLNPQTTYYFRVNAQNQYGTVNGTTQSFTTNGPAAAAAPVVTTQVASPIGATTATLRGTVNPSNAATTYWFEYSQDSLLGSLLLKTTPQHSAGSGNTTVSIAADISNLASGTTYYYRTVSQNAAGTVRADSLSFETN